ncbi:MAG: hypothetical protein ABGX83_05395 [Nitrospira sp.]
MAIVCDPEDLEETDRPMTATEVNRIQGELYLRARARNVNRTASSIRADQEEMIAQLQALMRAGVDDSIIQDVIRQAAVTGEGRMAIGDVSPPGHFAGPVLHESGRGSVVDIERIRCLIDAQPSWTIDPEAVRLIREGGYRMSPQEENNPMGMRGNLWREDSLWEKICYWYKRTMIAISEWSAGKPQPMLTPPPIQAPDCSFCPKKKLSVFFGSRRLPGEDGKQRIACQACMEERKEKKLAKEG